MRILVQRIASAQVSWPGGATTPVGAGLLALVGLNGSDAPYLLEPMADKLVHLRVFEDEGGRMNRSLRETGGALVLVPQFTLYADCRRGRRPSFSGAMAPDAASPLYARFVALCGERGLHVQSGEFGAHMHVQLINDGPVTILLDSDELGLTRP